MNSNDFDQEVREIVSQEVGSIPVPTFDFAAIDSRIRVHAGGQPSSASLRRLIAVMSVVAIGLLLLSLPGVSAVVAQVERAMHAFTKVDGRLVELDTRVVGLDQAREDMPFRVIAPAAVPFGSPVIIREFRPNHSSTDASLMFEYGGDTRSTAALSRRIDITEVSARTSGVAREILFTVNARAVHLPTHAKLGAPMYRKMIRLDTATWVVDGTRVRLSSAPGTLTSQQTNAIRAAMSH